MLDRSSSVENEKVDASRVLVSWKNLSVVNSDELSKASVVYLVTDASVLSSGVGEKLESTVVVPSRDSVVLTGS